MERSDQSFGFHTHKEPPAKTLTNGEKTVNRIFYGLGKVGKAIESQSPRAWNERIIKVINEKIIPKLTPEQLAAVAKHHKGIETGAQIAGFGISAAELYATFLLAGLGVQQIDRLKRISTYKKILRQNYATDWYRGLSQAYTGAVKDNPAGYPALAGTLLFLVDRIRNAVYQPSNTSAESTGAHHVPTRVFGPFLKHGGPRHAESVLFEQFRQARQAKELYEQKIYHRRPTPQEDFDAKVQAEFNDWKATRFYGLHDLVNLGNVRDQRAREVFLRLQGIQQHGEGSRRIIDYIPIKGRAPSGIDAMSGTPMDTVVEVDLDKEALQLLQKEKDFANMHQPQSFIRQGDHYQRTAKSRTRSRRNS